MLEAILNGEHTFTIDRENGSMTVNGKRVKPQVSRFGPKEWHLLLNGRSFTVLVHGVDRKDHRLSLSVNGKKVDVQLATRVEKLIRELGLEKAMDHKISEVRAPMPGLIHSIKVKAGDTLKTGDPILILEAMKMENVIKSPGEATVAEILVSEKEAVDKNDVMVRFE